MTMCVGDYPRGECEELEGDFLLRFTPSRGGFRSIPSPHSHTHRKGGNTVSNGAAEDRGRKGAAIHYHEGFDRGYTKYMKDTGA